MASLEEYRRKRDAREDARAVRRRASAGKAPIFVVQRHDARRLHYDFRLERDGALASWAVPKGVPLEPGHAAPRRPRRGPPARVRDVRGRDPGGPVRRRHGRDLGPGDVRARRGEAGRRPDRPAARRAAGRRRGRSSRRSSDGDPKNWLLLRKRDDGAGGGAPSRAPTGRCWPRSPRRSRPATTGSTRSSGTATARSSHARGRRGRADEPQGPRLLTPASPAVARASCRRRCARRTASSTARSARSTTRAAPSFSAMQQGKPGRRSSTTSSTCSRWTASRSSTCRWTSGASGWTALLDTRQPDRAALGVVRRRRGAVRGGEGAGARGRDGQARGLALPAGRRSRTTGSRSRRTAARSSSSPATRRARAAASGGFGALVLGVRRGRRAASTPATSARASTTRDDRRLLGEAEAARARRRRRSREVPKMPKVRKGDVVWVEPELVARGRVRRVDARRPAARAVVPGPARGQGARSEVRREEPMPERDPARASACCKLSNLDKPFWPEEGITKGDLLAYYRDVAPVLVPHLKDRPFTMKRYPGRLAGQVLLPEGRADAHAGLDQDASRISATSRETAREADDRLPARERRARAAVDGEHGLHRPEHVVLAGRQAGPARTSCSSTSIPSADVGFAGDGRGGAAREAGARRARARVASRRRAAPTGCTCSSRSSGGTRTTRRASSRRSSPARWRATHPGLVTTEWTKAKRRGVLIDSNQNGEGKTIASVYSVRPQAGRAGVDAAALGRGERGARPGGVHDGRRAASAIAQRRRPVRGRADDEAVARRGAGLAPLSLSRGGVGC